MFKKVLIANRGEIALRIARTCRELGVASVGVYSSADNGLTFVGPTPGLMAALGDKSSARRLMSDAGLPLLPGSVAPIGTAAEAVRTADEIGYPVIIKAVAGGGGK